MPKIKRSYLNQAPDPQRAALEAQRAGYDIVEDVPSPRPAINQEALVSSPEMQFALGGGQQGFINTSAPPPSPGEIRHMALPTLGALGATAVTMNPLAAPIGTALGESADYAITNLSREPDVPLWSRGLDVAASGILPMVSEAASAIGAARSGVAPATRKITSRMASSKPLMPTEAQDIVKPNFQGAQADIASEARLAGIKAKQTRSPLLPERDAAIDQIDNVYGFHIQGEDLVDAIIEEADRVSPGPTAGPGDKEASAKLLKIADDLSSEIAPDGTIPYGRVRQILTSFQRGGFEGTGRGQVKVSLANLQHTIQERAVKQIMESAGDNTEVAKELMNRLGALNDAIGNRQQATKDFVGLWKNRLTAEQRVRAIRSPQATELRHIIQEFDNQNTMAGKPTNLLERMDKLALKEDWNPSDMIEARNLGQFSNRIIPRTVFAGPIAKAATIYGPSLAPLGVFGLTAPRMSGPPLGPEDWP